MRNLRAIAMTVSLAAPLAFESEILCPKVGIFRDQDPGALHQVGPHPLVPAPGDSPLARSFSCRVFCWGQADVGGYLLRALEPRYVLQFDKEFYSSKFTYAWCSTKEFDLLTILLVTT